MKKTLLLLALMLLVGAQTAAVAQELTVSDFQNSGCVGSTRASDNKEAIVLTKEGTTLKVQLFNIVADCDAYNFSASASSGTNNGVYLVSINVRYTSGDADCFCPYNLSFTLHGLETNSFFLSCLWYQGMVDLTDGEPLVLGDTSGIVMKEASIDGLNYTMEDITLTARLKSGSYRQMVGDLNIPSEVSYEGKKYTVMYIGEYALAFCSELTSVTIPRSVVHIDHAAFFECSGLTDVYCYADNVPTTEYSAFLNASLATATLHVPAGSIDKYKTTSPWSGFGSIEALPTPKILPFVQKGKVWYYKADNPDVSPEYYKEWEEIYSLEGDTVIGSHQSLKLYLTCNSPYKSYNHAYIGAMYEKGGKVYYIAPNNTTSAILYDFSCDVGDIVKMDMYDIYSTRVVKWDEYELKINDKQLVKYRDEYLTVMNWSPIYDDEVFDLCTIWIEGVGSTIDLLNSTPIWNDGCIYKELLTCKLNDQIIYDKDEFIEYYPALEQRCFTTGTKWTEIRLDTLRYDSWYSKIGDELVPNFETVEYYVKLTSAGYEGKISDYVFTYDVYTNGPEWSDSLTFVLYEFHTEDDVCIKAMSRYSLAQAYQFNWFVGKELYYQNIVPYFSSSMHSYGTIEEIKEGDFGGVRPLKYVDLNGVRIIQGIGVTEWNDGECLFGPVNLYRYSSSQGTPPERHYRSMLVHFERNGEVLYDVWPEKAAVTEEPVTFTAGQIATIVLPTVPDASKGKYYRLDRCEDGQIIFEQELHPQAHIPYIIVPSEDFSIDTSTLDLAGLSNDTVSIGGISFIGSYSSETLNEPEGFYFDIIDTTPDCGFSTTEETGKVAHIGALRAYLQVSWDEPYNHGGSKAPGEKLGIVLKDYGTSIGEIHNSQFIIHNEEGAIYDLQGRRISGKSFPLKGVRESGIYIENGKKKLK